MNKTIDEIPNGEIDVEAIMASIREKMRRRQASGESPAGPDPQSLATAGTFPAPDMQEYPRDLSYINTNWDIRNTSYFIRSHRPGIGRILVKGRQVVHGEVCRYVDPMISRQTEFNASIVRILSQTLQDCAELDRKISRGDAVLAEEISRDKEEFSDRITRDKVELSQRISREKEEVLQNIQKSVDSSLDEIFSRIDEDLRLRMGLVHILEQKTERDLARKRATAAAGQDSGLNYLLFEDRFRGSREDILQRQRAFLPWFENCSRVLDIGCGRGEFLQILKDHGICGTGVDLDDDMVAFCRSLQLNVEKGDALAYLEKLDDNSLDGIFIDQVVEHLEPADLARLLALCYQKLQPGHFIVVETVNPLSYVSFANFYIDLSHTRPVHPDTLQFLMNVAGFRECEKKFFSPVPTEAQLQKMSESDGMALATQHNIDVYNRNIDMLNAILFGAQDYAVIGKK